jgi:ubiquinone/menaquinone biosynthesis C-methylase UbiE
MQISEAADMIRCPLLTQAPQPLTWADLGCGSGIFTKALGSLLPEGSTIYAIDSDRSWQPENTAGTKAAYIFQQADFVQDELRLPALDGILMANSLHYVKDKAALLSRLVSYCKPGAAFLLVEYDTGRAGHPWVPYPIKFSLLSELFLGLGFYGVQLLHQRPSVYRSGNMYSALITRNA